MKKNKSNIKIVIIFIVIGILLFGYLGYRVYIDFFKNSEPTKELDSIGLYGYTLVKSDTDLFETNFKALSKVLNEKEINYEEYAKDISKLFIIDLFTLSNKLGSTDIGGTEFVHKDFVSNFKENMGNTIYKNIESNINGDRTMELPEVASVEIGEISKEKFKYNSTEYDAFIVPVTWTYAKDLGYQTSMKITIIEDSKVLYIVKGE